MESIWSEKRPRVSADKRELPPYAEVVIIGGGMAGLLCAYLLKEAGISPIVLEASSVCSGQTKNTTAKITSQHGLIYDKLRNTCKEATAIQYGKWNERAINEYEQMIRKKKIDCGFVRLPSYLYTKTNEGADLLKKEYEMAQKAGIPATLITETLLPFDIKLALKYDGQAQFHPLEFLSAIVQELEIYERTRVTRIKGQTVFTERGMVKARKVVIATHFPFINYPGFYFAKMHQERSYVIAIKPEGTETKGQLDGMYYGIDEDGLSFRSSDGLILIGGKSERTGAVHKENPFDALQREAGVLWPGHRKITHWAAQDCVTLDGLPYIGRFSKLRSDWYVATGFEKWGMTNSMIAAMAIRDMILGEKLEDWSSVSPQRKLNLSSLHSLGKEVAVSTRNFITFKKPRCPHLGCRLVWNRYERTWDCPCHGSRFSKNREVIDNPAQRPMC